MDNYFLTLFLKSYQNINTLNLKQQTNLLARKSKILLAIGVIIIGWFLNAFAWTTTAGHPLSTIFLLLGLVLFIGGLIFLILTLSKKK